MEVLSSMMTLILGGLITWRISHMLVKEMGPLAIFARFRAFLASRQTHQGGLFDLISCPYCVSLYIGAVAALGASHGVLEWITYTFAFSAVSTFLERIFARL